MFSDFDLEDSDSDSGLESDAEGGDADDEMSDSESLENGWVGEDDGFDLQPSQVSKHLYHAINDMFEHRYEVEQKPIPKGASHMQFILTRYKLEYPHLFRQQLRVSPHAFDKLYARIKDDKVFTNQSQNDQIPVQEQLAILLYRFSHYGNGAGHQEVAIWAAVGKGTVTLVTRRVLTAILHPGFMEEAVRLPTEEEKEEAKEWVEQKTCVAWRNGWVFVDGTLVPLSHRPYWYGESYFNRKANYSLNFQIVSLPNLCIIDFGYGHVGSTHDATAWEDTRFAREHDELLPDGEWIWADSAYPILSWMVEPYKKPLRDLPENQEFNKYTH